MSQLNKETDPGNSSNPAPQEPKPSILLVDDEPDTLLLISYTLEKAGFDVIRAENGFQALEKVRQQKPNLAILDRMMPGMDGIEVLREFRKLYPDLLIILLTAMGSERDRLEGWEAGADDYIVKPINFKELIFRIKARLRRNPELKNSEVVNGLNKARVFGSDNLPVRTGLTDKIITAPTEEEKNRIAEGRRLQAILLKASRAAQADDYTRARELYQQALELDAMNEIALKWLAYRNTDPYEGCQYLERLVEAQPQNVKAQKLLEAGRRRVEELDRQSFSSIMTYLKTPHTPGPTPQPNTSGPTRRLLGQLLVEKGYISKENIETAASLQEIFRQSGEPKKLGEILTEYGYLTEEQLQRVLKEQES
jgi:DNA-binding response OmpR family regulator